jgi:SAM-dependent methyltransferase
MDAEFLARAGATVISSDLSLGAAKRAAERARRYGLALEPVVADVERLPFRDQAFDLVYVHDGLHHLERPDAGLAEMARVADRVVSVSEPARAAATAVAVRLGLAQEQEEAGNRVARLTLEEVADELRSHGFRIVEAERYAMRYSHHPGLVVRWLSSAPLFPLACVGLRALNLPIGRFGNKLTVQAMRDGVPAAEGDHRPAKVGGDALCV